MLRVAAEILDVVSHALQCLHDVQHAHVAGAGEFIAPKIAQECEAHDIEAMIDGHHDHVAALAQVGAIVARRGTGAGLKAAAVNPEHHGALAAVGEPASPHVQDQAILAFGLVAQLTDECG